MFWPAVEPVRRQNCAHDPRLSITRFAFQPLMLATRATGKFLVPYEAMVIAS